MGNELCDTIDNQPEYIRNQYKFWPNTPMSQQQKITQQISSYGIISPLTNIPTQKPPSNTISIVYNKHLIQCHNQSVHHLNHQKPPIINGTAKVYKSQHPTHLLYQGELRNSRFDGYGKLYQHKKNQLLYQGQFKKGLFDGWGITKEYVGEWREGKYDGYGVYQQFSQQDSQIVTFYYEGYFQNGLYSGSGVLINDITWPLKEIKKIHQEKNIIDYLNQQIEHGMNLIKKYGAKEIYIGQFSNGFKHGFGRLFTDKIQFNGQFSHNLYHGFGTVFNHAEGKKVVKAIFKMGKEFKQ